MKWNEVKETITSLSDIDKNQLELTAALVSYRRSKNISKEQLAELANISYADINSFENLSVESFYKNFLKVTRALGLSLTLRENDDFNIFNQN